MVAALPAPRDTAEVGARALAAGRAAGLDAVGVTTAEPFAAAQEVLEDRKAAGLHGGMGFTYRNPGRSADPRATLPGARALVAGARAYGGGPLDAPGGDRPHGRVARYAWGDHYGALAAGLEAVAGVLREGGWRALVIADQNHLVDRAVAHRAGLGWFGKSSLLLLPGAGSWFVLGAVLTDAPLAATAEEPVPDGCGGCTRCLAGCPTGAIVAPGVVDARRCLAWVVQAPGVVPRDLRVALHDRLYGCDDCQEVCPPNRVELRRHAPTTGASPDERPWVDLIDLLDADDATLIERHGRWYIADRDPRHLRRNALVALGNVGDPGDPAVAAVLRRVLVGGDDMLAAHAAWAARRLGRDDLLAGVGPGAGPDLRAELAAPAPPVRGREGER